MRYHLNLQGIYLPRFDSAVLEDVVTSVCNEDRYHYGYNGQMKVNEWAGLGNHTSALFWEYDARIGRRLNRDPIAKAWASDFSTFSNNPLIYADPNGNTDYFNIKGGNIGTDGISNGVKLLVLKRSTTRSIERQMKENSRATLGMLELKNTHLVPSAATLKKYDEIFSKTNNGNGKEYGMAAGTATNGGQVSSSIGEGSNGSQSGIPDYNVVTSGNLDEYHKAGGSGSAYIVHSHPNAIKELLSGDLLTSGD